MTETTASTTDFTSEVIASNLGSGDAQVTVTFYHGDGSVESTSTETIGAGKSKFFFAVTRNIYRAQINSDKSFVAVGAHVRVDFTADEPVNDTFFFDDRNVPCYKNVGA